MPTIDIPDKICPHCGGTRWYLRKLTSYQTCINCKMERDKKYPRVERNKKYFQKRKITEEHKEYWKKYNKESSRVLTKTHVKRAIVYKTGISCLDVPDELVEIKRKEILLKRQIKNNGKSNQHI